MGDKLDHMIGTALVAAGVRAAITGDERDRREHDAGTPTGHEAGREAVRLAASSETSLVADGDGTVPRLKSMVDRWQRRHATVAFAAAVVKKYGEDGGSRLGATIAYFAFFSVFPAMLALVAVAGFVLQNNDELRADLVDTAVGSFPVIGDSITDASLGGSSVAVVIGVAGALWAGLGAMLAAQHAFNAVWGVPWHERPDAIRSRLRGLVMFAVIALGLVVATVLSNLVTALDLPLLAWLAIAAANVVVNVVMAFLAFQILTARHLRWGDLWPGAVVAGAAFYGLQILGSSLVTRYVAGADDTYGTFALVIGLLTWFHLAAQVTLIAAEINVVRARKLHPRSLFGHALTDADDRALLGHQRAAARHEAAEPAAVPRSAAA